MIDGQPCICFQNAGYKNGLEVVHIDIKYGPFEEWQRDGLVKIINDTWNVDRFGYPPEVGLKYSASDLEACLSIATFTEVAILDGQPVGYIFGRCEDAFDDDALRKAKRTDRQIKRKLRFSRYGRAMLGFKKLYMQSDDKLLEDTGKEYGGELVFFAISPEARGKGVGKRLFSDLLAYMKQNGVREFYVFTDTTCDHSFYDHNGFVQRGALPQTVEFRKNEEMTFFIYDYNLSENDA